MNAARVPKTDTIHDLMMEALYHAPTLADAGVFTDLIIERGGPAYRAIEVAGRTELVWCPRVGDGVCSSINGDTYYDGVVVRVTKTTIEYAREGQPARKGRFSAKRGTWRPEGNTYSVLHPGTQADEKRDPHF